MRPAPAGSRHRARGASASRRSRRCRTRPGVSSGATGPGSNTAYPAERAAPDKRGASPRAARARAGADSAGRGGTLVHGPRADDGTLVTLDGLAGLAAHDAATLQATLRAGTRLGDIGPALAAIGQEMPNLPDINKQSLAGALATGHARDGPGVQGAARRRRRLPRSRRRARSSSSATASAERRALPMPPASGSARSAMLTAGDAAERAAHAREEARRAAAARRGDGRPGRRSSRRTATSSSSRSRSRASPPSSRSTPTDEPSQPRGPDTDAEHADGPEAPARLDRASCRRSGAGSRRRCWRPRS